MLLPQRIIGLVPTGVLKGRTNIGAVFVRRHNLEVNLEAVKSETENIPKAKVHAKWVKAIHEKYKPIEEEYLRIELANSHKNLSENEKRELFAPVRSKLLPGVGSNHRPIGYNLLQLLEG